MYYITEEANKLPVDGEDTSGDAMAVNLSGPTEVFEHEKEADEEFIREFNILKEDKGFMRLKESPFSSFTEDHVLIMAREIQGKRLYFVRECDVNAVKCHYESEDADVLGYDSAMEKIAAHNDIDKSDIVVVDESFDRYKMEISFIESKIMDEDDEEKKEELTEAMVVLAEAEQKRRKSMRLARIVEETIFDIL